MSAAASIAVAADAAAAPWRDAAQRDAAALARKLHLPRIEVADAGACDMLLVATGQCVELRIIGAAGGDDTLRGGRPIFVDLLQLDVRSGAGRSLKQPLARAVGLTRRASKAPLRVVDATAGLGEDAWLLASLGCRVTAVERQPIVAALLRDGLQRAAAAQPDIAERIELREGDSRSIVAAVDRHDVDVIYLDPMFPVGRRRVERKAMRVLRQLAGSDEDAAELLDAALATGVHRVVVKRPTRASPLGDRKPTTTHKGRALRYDVYA